MGLVRCVGCRVWVRGDVVRCGLCGVTVLRSKRAMEADAGEEADDDAATATGQGVSETE